MILISFNNKLKFYKSIFILLIYNMNELFNYELGKLIDLQNTKIISKTN